MNKNFRSKRIKFVFAIVALTLTITGCTKKEIVAKVNNTEITKDELYEQLVKQGGTEALDALIADKIVEAEIEKEKIVISKEEIDKNVDEMKEYYGSQEELDKAIESYGISMDEIKKNITSNLQIKKILEPYIEITDEEMSTYFEANKESFNQKEQVKASHILVETKELADEIKAKLDKGDDFAKLAKEYSTDKSNSESGGELGYFSRGEMEQSFENAAFSMKIGDISNPVQTTFGFHIIKLEDKKEAKQATYEEVKDNIKDAIFQEKMGAAYNTWYQEKLGEYKIENYLTEK